jgi:hypothetical protein
LPRRRLSRRSLPWRSLSRRRCRRRLLDTLIPSLVRCGWNCRLLRILASRRTASRAAPRGRACGPRFVGRPCPGGGTRGRGIRGGGIRGRGIRGRSSRSRSTGSRRRTRARCRPGLRRASSGQPRRRIAVGVVQPHRHVFRFSCGLCRLRSIRQVRSRAHPRIHATRILTMQRSANCKQSLRIPRLLDLIDGARVQRHRHRICLIGAGIVELPIDQNCDRNQRPLAVARQLQKPHRSRPFDVFLLRFRGLLRRNVFRALKLWSPLRRAQRDHCDEKRQNDDDGRP